MMQAGFLRGLEKYIDLLQDHKNPIAFFFILAILLLAVIFVIYFLIYKPLVGRLHNEMVLSKDSYKKLTFYLQKSIEKEKQKIRMDLHDSIAQNISFASLQLSTLPESSEKRNVAEILKNSLADLRTILFDLLPKELELLGLYKTACQYLVNLNKILPVNGKIDIQGEYIRLKQETELSLFRIIQESISNIIKHSECTEFRLNFYYDKSFLTIKISDNGKGFDTSVLKKGGGYGLLNMMARIKALGGTHKINSNHNGTEVFIIIPIKEN